MKKWLGVALAASLMLAACSTDERPVAQTASDRLQVVTTFYPMYEFTKRVAGDHANVTALVPIGVEPHDWEPTAKDMSSLAQADLFVFNGAGMESWTEEALKGIENSKLIVVEATAGIELLEGEEHDHNHDGHDHAQSEHDEHEHGEDEHHEQEEGHHLDPHVWLDPVLAQQQVESIKRALIKADPDHRSDYERNATAYLADLQELDQEFRTAVQNGKRKEFVTQHAAFSYLAKRYGLKQVPISGLSPEVEPSAAQMAEIVAFAKEHQVKTIYFETLVSPKIAERVAKEIGAQTAVLNPLEGLTKEEQTSGHDYISIMKQNLSELKKSLDQE